MAHLKSQDNHYEKKTELELISLGTYCSLFDIPLSEIPTLTDDQREQRQQRKGKEEEEKDMEHSDEQTPLRSSGLFQVSILTTHMEPKTDIQRKGDDTL